MFLSFDVCHILKNLRSLLLSMLRSMMNNGKPISEFFLRELYNLQKDLVVKPVRRLTYKHVYPTNLDKMHVGRAVDIFSTDVITALSFLRQHGSRSGITSFRDADGTIEFIKNINKWITILNVRNTTYHIQSRNQDAMQFFSIDD